MKRPQPHRKLVTHAMEEAGAEILVTRRGVPGLNSWDLAREVYIAMERVKQAQRRQFPRYTKSS
jgi:hypothetical protein